MATNFDFIPAILLLIFLLWVSWRLTKALNTPPMLRSVAILVLGDIGRSPRMMYHAESFAKLRFNTYLIGYRGSKPAASLSALPFVQFGYLSEPPNFVTKIPFIIAAPIKILHQIITIFLALTVRIPSAPEFIMVQNPPSIPTLAVVWIVGRIRGSKVIIDWHNLGYSILALKLGQNHPFVKLAKRFEMFYGRTAYAHLFVTQAMCDYLSREWCLKGKTAVLHDRPPSHFHKATPGETHELFLRIGPVLSHPSLSSFLPSASPPYTTPFTETSPPSSGGTDDLTLSSNPSLSSISMPSLRPDRPALLVSSTSWTPDEDFSILLQALQMYEARASTINSSAGGDTQRKGTLPPVWMVITGKGPLKEKYMSEVETLQKEWKWVRCTSLWLDAEDYPTLLGSADLGVCLHSSSSALDLPMKVVDMFGCGLPVCALDFACLGELVKDRQNGLIFKSAEQLAAQLESLLTSFPSSPALSALRASLAGSYHPSPGSTHTRNFEMHLGTGTENVHWEWNTWTENWTRVVKPLVVQEVGIETKN